MRKAARRALRALLVLYAAVPGAARGQDVPRPRLVQYLDSLADARLDRRAADVAALRTRADAEARRRATRATVLALIGGLPERSGPPAVRSFGSVRDDGFRIERIVYESLPGFPVPANVYVPDSGPGPFPAVILTPGHDPAGKVGQYAFAASLARAGILALAYDPISEGERTQYLDPATGASRVGRVTGEHGMAGMQTLPIGDQVARYFVWDAMRGIDYLQGRADVDPARIGAFGCSGGGTVTAYLAALDERVKAAVSACYVTSFRELLHGGDPQEGEQSIPGFLARGLDLPDWVEMAAPRPFAIVSTTEDFFPFAGARRAYEEAKRVYGLYGAADRLEWFTGPGGHGNLAPIGNRIVTFFGRWLADRPDSARFFPGRAPAPDSLRVTPTGQVGSSLGGETVYSLNRARAARVLPAPRRIDGPRGLERLRARLPSLLRQRAGIRVAPGGAPPAARVLGSSRREGYRVERLALAAEGGLELEALAAIPERRGPRPALLLLDAAPLDSLAAPGGELDRRARAGTLVLALHPRGLPEGTEETKAALLGHAYLLSLRAQLVGRSLVGMRAEDAIHALDWLAARPDVDPDSLGLRALGTLAVPALHAAALDPRVSSLELEHYLPSWRLAVERPLHRYLPEIVVAGALLDYDLPDLLRATHARRVRLVDPVDALGLPLPERATGG